MRSSPQNMDGRNSWGYQEFFAMKDEQEKRLVAKHFSPPRMGARIAW
jgi:hypothetical protein